MRTLSAVTAALAAIALAPASGAEEPLCGPDYCAFFSPSGHISCELLHDYHELPDAAYCQWEDGGTGYSVTLRPDGVFESCLQGSCLGNAGIGTPTLPYGQTAAIGSFSCLSATSGVTCTAAPSGRGFTISGAGIAPAG